MYGKGNSLAVGGRHMSCVFPDALPEEMENRTKFLFTRASVAVEIRFMFLSEQNIADISYHLS
jgi:hypothetical protein